MMGICGNVPTNEMKGYSGIRQNGFQEMDLVSMTRNITKYSVTANSGEGFADIVSRAYNMAMLGRKGGVIIDFPLNIQQTDIVGR
jgi:acetolactate synthase-1/2/3 large subunit